MVWNVVVHVIFLFLFFSFFFLLLEFRSRLSPFVSAGQCVICDSFVNPAVEVRICDECNYGTFQGKCVICGGNGVADAFYCVECCALEKDRDGCPKIINLGMAKKDRFYENKKYKS